MEVDLNSKVISRNPENLIWLMKSEPEVYSIDDLRRDRTTWWEGVRNYQARNFMLKNMQVGDLVLFYHSNASPPGIVGLGKIVNEAEPDKLQFDKTSPYFDPKSISSKPIWFCVEVGYLKTFPKIISLEKLRKTPELQNMQLLKKGQRLSIQPVTPFELEIILNLTEKLEN